MKVFLPLAVLVMGAFLALAYFHSRSIDRAQFTTSANDLLVAHQQLRESGRVADERRVSVWTNRIAIGGTVFQGELIAHAPALADMGSLVLATGQTLIWIDKKTGPAVVRGAYGQLVTPRRLHDF